MGDLSGVSALEPHSYRRTVGSGRKFASDCFAGQRLRSQTDNIGLTRISEGTELIRIGVRWTRP